MDFLELESLSNKPKKEVEKAKKNKRAERIKKTAKAFKESFDKKKQIATCKDCNGQPLTEPFSVQGINGKITGIKCVECYLVIKTD